MSGTWVSGWVTGDVVPAAEYKKGVGMVYDSTASGAVASFDTGATIPGGYAHLLVEAYLRGDTAATNVSLGIRFNNDSGTNYNYSQHITNNATILAAASVAQTSIVAAATAGSSPASAFSPVRFEVAHYANASGFKALSAGSSWWETADTAAGQNQMSFSGLWKSTAALTRITVTPAAGNWVAGSRFTVYVMGA